LTENAYIEIRLRVRQSGFFLDQARKLQALTRAPAFEPTLALLLAPVSPPLARPKEVLFILFFSLACSTNICSDVDTNHVISEIGFVVSILRSGYSYTW
jgi:hypothetical protein